MLQEFREFVARGNVIDLAVGIIVGASFTAIVNSIVNDLVNPLLGLATAGINFNDLALSVGGATIAYGKFVTAVINFFLVAFVVFLIVKAVNRVKRAAERHARDDVPSAPAGPTELEVLVEIRDALRGRTAGQGLADP